MKQNRTYAILVLLGAIVLMCAAFLLPAVSFQNGKLVYRSARVSENVLEISADYSAFGDSFMILRDVTVATDRAFTNLLQTSCTPEDGTYVYRCALTEPVDRVYIAPPTLLVPETIEARTLSTSSAKASPEQEKWFSIDDVRVEEPQNGICEVIVTITPHTELLPRFMFLSFGEKTYSGLIGIDFDANVDTTFAEYRYNVPAVSAEDLTRKLPEGRFEVSEVLRIVRPEKAVFSSTMKSLEVISD